MGEGLHPQDDAWREGQRVQITAGPFIGSEGVILLINREDRLVRVKINIFGKTAPVEVPITSVQALQQEK